MRVREQKHKAFHWRAVYDRRAKALRKGEASLIVCAACRSVEQEAWKPFISEPSMDRRAHEQARPAERHGGRESETLQDVEVERRASAT